MPYCSVCNRPFDSAQALRQHKENSDRHARKHAAAAAPARRSRQITAFSSEMPYSFAGGPAGSMTQVARETVEGEPSRFLLSALRGYDHFVPVVPPSFELADVNNTAARLYSNGEYSDLVISCGGEEYHVHKAIVCTQSEFLAASCRGDFKENQEGKIDLSDDDPRLVHIVVHYLYHSDYDLRHEQTDVDKPMMDVLVTHAKVYALAEQYLIHGLKAVALRHFKAATKVISPDSKDFYEAMREVYTSTIDSDRGLRDIIVETLGQNSAWLDKDEVRDVAKGLGSLMYDLVMYLHQRNMF